MAFRICMTCYGKVDHLAGKIYFVQKKHLKTPKIMDNFSDRLTLEGAGGRTGDTRSTFGVPLKSLGYKRSNQLLWRLVASKLWVNELHTFFWGTDKEIREKRNFFVNCSLPKNFQWENFSGHAPRKSLRTQHSKNKFKNLLSNFWTLSWLSEVG